MAIPKYVNFFQSETGSTIVSIILGLGLAALFGKSCIDNRGIIIKQEIGIEHAKAKCCE